MKERVFCDNAAVSGCRLFQNIFQRSFAAGESRVLHIKSDDGICDTAHGNKIPSVAVAGDGGAAKQRLIADGRNDGDIYGFICAVAGHLLFIILLDLF